MTEQIDLEDWLRENPTNNDDINVAKNVAQGNSQHLTEQWKNDKLLSGWYYTKLWKGCNVIDKFIGNQFLRYDDSDIVEVIAPVPSYEEYSRLEWYAGCGPDRIIELAKENQQLKDIISKMCMELVDPNDDMSNGLAEYFNQYLLLEIHEVLK